MNKDKRVTVRFTKKEYETLKNKSKAYGIENLSLYIRKKIAVWMLRSSDHSFRKNGFAHLGVGF